MSSKLMLAIDDSRKEETGFTLTKDVSVNKARVNTSYGVDTIK